LLYYKKNAKTGDPVARTAKKNERRNEKKKKKKKNVGSLGEYEMAIIRVWEETLSIQFNELF